MQEIVFAARVITLVSSLLISVGCSPRIQSGVLNPGQTGVLGAGVSQSTMVANPAILQADGNSSSRVTVSLRDQNGNPVAGKSVTLFSNRGSLDTIPTPSAVSDMNGDVSFQVLSAHSGTSLFSATDVTDHQVISSSASVLFLPGSVIPSQTTLLASQNTVVADGVSSTQIVVTLRDAQGNPVVGKSVSLASNRGGDVISPPNGLTGNSGSISFTVSSTTSGVSLLTATDLTDNLTFPEVAQVTFTAGAGNSIQSTVTASPTSVIANGTSTSTITVALKDSYGNPVPGKVVTLSSNRGGSDTLSSSSGPSNSSGLVTFTVKSTSTGTSTFTATDTTDSATLAQMPQVTFTAGPVSAAQSTLSTSASSVADDGSSTATLTVTLKDANGNPVSGKTVTLSSSRGGSDTISGASGPSSSLGVVTFTVKSAHAGSSIYSASDSTDSLSLTQTASVNYTTGSVSSSNSTLTASQTSIAADGTTTSTLTVTLKDSTGNPVQGKTVTLSSSRGATDTLSAASGSSNSSGMVTFTVKSSTGGNSTFTAVDSTDSVTINQTASVTFVASLVSASQSTVSASPSSILADGSTSSTITVTLKDSGGSPVAGKSVSLTSSRGASDTISSASGASNSSGIVTFTVKSTVAGSPVFTALDSTDSVTITQTASVTFTAGSVSASQSTITSSPATIPADGSTTSTITVTLNDSHSNPVSGKTVTLSSSRGAQDTISAASGVSSAGGVVTFTVKSTTAGSSSFTAVDSTDSITLTQIAGVSFTAGGVSATQSLVSVSPSAVVADGATTSTVTVTLKDANGNPLSGKTVSLTSSRGGNDAISAPSGVSSSGGVVTFTVTSTHAGSATFTATDSTDGVTITQTGSVTFTSGPVAAAQSTVSTSPTSVVADGSTTSTVTVTLLDANSNPVSGKTVTLSSSRGASDSISSASGASNGSGIVTFTVSSSTVGTSTFTAVDTTDSVTVTQTGSVSFVVGAVSTSTSTVVSSPTLVSGNGSATSTITVTLLDSNSHPISGKTVSLTSSRGGSDTISATNSTTNASGQAVFTVLSSTVGNAVLTPQDTTDSVTLTQTATVHFYGNLATSSKMIAIPASIPADGSTQTTISLTLLDSTATPIPGKTITLSSTREALDTITPSSATTDSNGLASFTLSSSKIGMPTLQATDTSDSVAILQTVQPTLMGSGSSTQTEYKASTALSGFYPGNNSYPAIPWKDAFQSSGTNDAALHGFAFTSTDGWAGDGTLLTGTSSGPFRLTFNGNSDYLDMGASINSDSSFSFDTWIRPQSPTTSGSIILSTADSSNRGFNLSQVSDGSGKISLAPAGISSVYSQVVLADSPLMYWKLDETSGTTANDSSGNGNSGTYNPGSGSINLGQSGLFAGSGESALFSGNQSTTVYSNSNITLPGTYSVEVWFRTGTTTGGQLIEGTGNTQTGNSSDYVNMIYMSNSGNLNFGTSNPYVVSSPQAYNDNNVHHVVGTISVNGTILYVDGEIVASHLWGPIGSQTAYVRVGGDNIGRWPSEPSSYYFNGSIDEAAVYGSELSLQRVQAHYLAGTENCFSRTALATNVWNHLAGVFNSSGNTASLYLNGNQQCSIPLSGINYSGSGNNFTAGSSSSQTSFWSGAIASIKTYAQALTSSIVQQNYAATAATFDIQQLGAPAPIMWLRADAIQGLSDGTSISTWPDSSSNGNNATQGAPANQPVWKNKILNGYPVVRFNGSSSYMNGLSVFPVGSDYTIIAVVNVFNSSNSIAPSILAANGQSSHFFGFYPGGYLDFWQNNHWASAGASNGVFAINTPYIVTGEFVNSSSLNSYFVNGSAAGTGTTSQQNSDSSLAIGWHLTSANFFPGDIAEVLLFGSALSNNDRSLVETYLNAKYGIY